MRGEAKAVVTNALITKAIPVTAWRERCINRWCMSD
jgi:hypothetical protein